ncbi:MAG: tRNA lysidine(34) synthetase TilS [Betaproteobacteria bacterium]|nr:tRNA lysidine(34) synthetase TilS [Betaproteobacteria bacterium]
MLAKGKDCYPAGRERFRPESGRPRRELRKLLQEHAVPPWERDRLPLLWGGNDLVCARDRH